MRRYAHAYLMYGMLISNIEMEIYTLLDSLPEDKECALLDSSKGIEDIILIEYNWSDSGVYCLGSKFGFKVSAGYCHCPERINVKEMAALNNEKSLAMFKAIERFCEKYNLIFNQ